MPNEPSDLVQGTLDMLILKTLALGPRLYCPRYVPFAIVSGWSTTLT